MLSPSVIALLLSLADGGVAPRSPATRPQPAAAGKPAAAKPFTLVRPAAPARKSSAATKPATAAAKPGGKAVKKKKPPRPKIIELFHVNSKETLRLRFVDDKGKPIRDLQKRANHFFRCHHTRTVSRINPRLLRLLFDIGRHWPGQRLEVVSGYRNPKVAKNPRSPHMKGLACDFRVVGVPNTELRDYLRSGFKKVGVGYYPNSSFVHLDVRQSASAFWIDYSGPGENAMYSDNAAEDLKSGRAENFKPARIDPSWAEHDHLPGGPDGGAGAPPTTSAPAAARQDGSTPADPQVQ